MFCNKKINSHHITTIFDSLCMFGPPNCWINVLKRNNNEPILKDTVIVNPGYELFRESIIHTPYKWLDTLNNDSMRMRINADIQLLESIEPYLKLQRKAVLKLAVAKRLNNTEIFERFKSDFSFWEQRLHPKFISSKSPQEIDARVMGMLDYLVGLLETGTISPEEFTDVIEQSKCSPVLKILLVYDELIEFEKNAKYDSLERETYFTSDKFSIMLMAAHSNLVQLILDKEYFKYQDKFKRQLVDIQTYTFDFITKGWLSSEVLCNIYYPDQYQFWGYTLTKLAFLQSLTQNQEVPCESLRFSKGEGVKKYNDSWLDEIISANSNNVTGGWSHRVRYTLTHGEEIHSPYLFYLKKLYVNNQKSITPFVSSSNDMREFDLYMLASYHVDEWNPLLNYVADPEVNLLQMDKVIRMLKASQRRICPRQTNQLFLDYHLKALHYLNVYYEPGNARHTEIAQQSLQYIGAYYTKYAGWITPRLSLYIVNQLNAFHWVQGRYEGTWYARNILRGILGTRELTVEENDLYQKYLLYYN